MKINSIFKTTFVIALLIFLMSLNAYSLDYIINFTATGASYTVESVVVQNLTQGTSISLLSGNSITLTVTPNSIPLLYSNNNGISITQNSLLGNSTLTFFSKQAGKTGVSIFSIDGRKLTEKTVVLSEGNNSFQLSLPKGAFVIHISGNGYEYTTKLINYASLTNSPEISFVENRKSEVSNSPKIKKEYLSMSYNEGDMLLFKGISGQYASIVTKIPIGNTNINFNFVPCQDADGNNYSTVKIGNQYWMVENLKTTKYRNTEIIQNITDNTAWSSATIGAWCDYNNDATNGIKYGKLYNWTAVSNTLNIAPIGWHIPTDAEWTTLVNYLGGSVLAGGKLKGTGTTNWKTPNLNATNETGFTGLPAGYRHYGGTFYDVNLNYIGDNGYWWSANESSAGWAFTRNLFYNSAQIFQGIEPKRSGFSVRCVMDATIPTVTTKVLSATIETTGVFGGNVTEDGGVSVTARGICWATSTHPTILDSKTTDGIGVGSFSSSIKGLIEDKDYYFRAYATNSVGTAYGNEISFTTKVFNQTAVFAQLYSTLGLTGSTNPSGGADIISIDESRTSFFRLIWNLNELTTDEAICSWGDVEIPEMNFNQFTASNEQLRGLYLRLYFNITICNRFLGEIALKTDEISKKQRAEARFIRALNYYYLLDMFGNVPLTEIPANTNSPQVNKVTLFNYIENELIGCEVNMYDAQQAPYGRADKVANWMLLSRLYLNSQIYIGNSKWQEASIYAKKVIQSGYSLCPTYKQLFMADNGGINDGSTVNKANQEIILPILADGKNASYLEPSLFLIASTHTSDMGAWGSNQGWAGNRARASLIKKFFPTGSTFFLDKTDLTTAILTGYKDNRALFNGAITRTLNITSVSKFKEGYSVIKFSNIRADGGVTSNINYTDMDIPFLRLAEAYLTYAEAAYRLGNTTEALTTINQLRNRAGAVSKTSIELNDILDEKAREFFFEGQRRTDLIRFGNYGGGTYNWDWKGGSASGNTFDSHFNLFPIPSTILDENPNLLQNPGY